MWGVWAIIADFYTPLLCFGVLWTGYRLGVLTRSVIGLSLCCALIFGFSFLEGLLGLWQRWGLDYSTHTAILLPFYQMLLVFVLIPFREMSHNRLSLLCHPLLYRSVLAIALVIALVSGVAYGVLMHHLGYHSLADMLTTLVSTYPLVWICFRGLKPYLKFS